MVRFTLFISILSTLSIYGLELKTGDMIFQSIPCYLCRAIEIEERSKFSHMGVVFKKGKQTFVAQSYPPHLRLVSLEDFMKQGHTKVDQEVIRFKEIHFTNGELFAELEKYIGLNYDHHFLFDNYDENGELLYCSEFVYKLFEPFYGNTLPIKRMIYKILYDFWYQYFDGDIPIGKWGNSPEDFYKSSLFIKLGKLQ